MCPIIDGTGAFCTFPPEAPPSRSERSGCTVTGFEMVCKCSEQSSQRGKNGLCVLLRFLPPSPHGGRPLCVLLLPFVGARSQCSSLLHFRQSVCRGRFGAVHSSGSGFTSQHHTLWVFISQYLCLQAVCQRGNPVRAAVKV